jgi:hypothetical protein
MSLLFNPETMKTFMEIRERFRKMEVDIANANTKINYLVCQQDRIIESLTKIVSTLTEKYKPKP